MLDQKLEHYMRTYGLRDRRSVKSKLIQIWQSYQNTIRHAGDYADLDYTLTGVESYYCRAAFLRMANFHLKTLQKGSHYWAYRSSERAFLYLV